MKKVLVTLLIINLTTISVFANSIKVFDKTGKNIGIARKIDQNYELFDLNGNELNTSEQLYAPIGVPFYIDKLNNKVENDIIKYYYGHGIYFEYDPQNEDFYRLNRFYYRY